mmetsp:Transcript_1865/g.5336  ORF Transcript_1865/g.5336 Transcript_1865/m.5336 type:complete len:478 (-) Transcript_1865:31-1464(-)
MAAAATAQLAPGLPLLRALWANRAEAGKDWGAAEALLPAAIVERVRTVFVLYAGGGRDGARVRDLVSVLAPEELARLSPLHPLHTIPFAGFAQWIADYFYQRWRHPRDDLHLVLDALESAVVKPLSAVALSPGSWVTAAVVALLGSGRRYARAPRPKPRAPDDAALAEKLAAEAAAALRAVCDASHAARRSSTAGGSTLVPEPLVLPALPTHGRVPAAAPEREPPPRSSRGYKERLDALCAAAYAPLLPDFDESLHPGLRPKHRIHAAEDILTAFKVEMLAKLRIRAGDGSAPDPAHDRRRCFQDDYAYWAEAQAGGEPALWREWRAVTAWVRDEAPSLLAQRVGAVGGGMLQVYEACFERPFEAGTIAVALTRVDRLPSGDADPAESEPGPWRVSAVRVQVTPGWMPEDPLHTWHDTLPFRDDPFAPLPSTQDAPTPGGEVDEGGASAKASKGGQRRASTKGSKARSSTNNGGGKK